MLLLILLFALIVFIGLSIVVSSTFFCWLFAICAVSILCLIIINYWVELYIAGAVLSYLGAGIIFGGAMSILWMTVIDYPLGPNGELIGWGKFFSFFYILWAAMGVVYVFVVIDAFSRAVNFLKKLL
jgi:hypothetical protein